jgi:hypothetical protein
MDVGEDNRGAANVCWKIVLVGCVDQTGQEGLMHMCECFALHAIDTGMSVTQERQLVRHEIKPFGRIMVLSTHGATW